MELLDEDGLPNDGTKRSRRSNVSWPRTLSTPARFTTGFTSGNPRRRRNVRRRKPIGCCLSCRERVTSSTCLLTYATRRPVRGCGEGQPAGGRRRNTSPSACRDVPLGYYPHNIHFIWMGATMSGQSALAIASARKVAAAIPAKR
jgi:hypothetical protein